MYGPFCLKIYLPTMNYTDAQDLCAGDGAHLYHYKNLADYRAPLEELLAANGDPAYIWVGAERPANDLTADFTWTDGTLLSDTADVWRDGEPTGGLNERCAERNNLTFGKQCGESGGVDTNTMDKWIDRLPEICEGYAERDTFNVDETGYFYKDTTDKTYFRKGQKCAGGKKSKERLTVMLCSNMTGDERERPMVIHRSAKPRCFKNIKTQNLPVIYNSNRKSWMTAALFEDWVRKFDRKMKAQGRRVLLFLDNATVHPKLTGLTNVKLQFFPANTTSVLQPLDQGIIQALKLKVRRKQLQFIMDEMDKDKTSSGPELIKKMKLKLKRTDFAK
nr:hypothetical protein BaRGS_017839 [Batillaria attramentaria]